MKVKYYITVIILNKYCKFLIEINKVEIKIKNIKNTNRSM